MNKYYWRCDKCNTLIKGKNYHEITKKDLDPKSIITIQGKQFGTAFILGGLESFDVGKRLYLIDGLLYIENKEQHETRIESDNNYIEDWNGEPATIDNL